MTENRKVLLEIRNLHKDFKIRSEAIGEKPKILHALGDVSLTVYEGETLGIIGESGCGKSTLGKCIVRLHEATGGEILYNGTDIGTLRGRELKALRREIQMVFQDPYSSLNPRKTAGETIEEPMVIHGTEPDRAKRMEIVRSLMAEVGLNPEHLYRYPHEFSGGQRQRINVARALALGPKLIVCDEPVSALDVSVQAQVLNLLSDLQKKMGLTYMFISHDLGVIRHISDRLAIMYLGAVVELCEADMVYEDPLHPYTKALLSAIPPDSPLEEKHEMPLGGEPPSPIGERVGCPLAERCPSCFDRCLRETPTLREVKPGHSVACFLY